MNTFTFPNGFRAIHERPQNRLGISALQVFVGFGSAHETLRGSAHFIEHMCFKGTRDFPTYHDLFLQQHRLGNMFNAITDQLYTVYTCKVNDEDLDTAIHLLASMMLESTFPNKDFATEERVVLEECLRSDDDGESRVHQDTQSLVYSGSSYAFAVDSTEYHKQKYNAKKIRELYATMYVPQNMILSIVTDVSFARVLQCIRESHYSRRRTSLLHPSVPPPTVVQVPKCQFRDKVGSETVHVQLSFRTCPRNHPDRFVLDLLKHIVGGTLGSKLFVFLRGKHGLTYVSRCDTNYNEFSGCLSFYAQVDKHKVLRNGNKGPGLVPLLITFIQDLVHHGLTAEELRVGKRNKQAQLHLALENLETHAEYNGREWLDHDDIVPIHHFYNAHFKGITRAQILRVCRTYLKNMIACFVGVIAQKKEIQHWCHAL